MPAVVHWGMAFSKLGNFNFHFAALPDLMWAFVFFFFLVCTRLPAQPPFAFFWFKMRRWPAFHHILIVWTGPQTEPPPLPWWVSGEADVMVLFFFCGDCRCTEWVSCICSSLLVKALTSCLRFRGQQAGDVICGGGVWEGPGGEQGQGAAAAVQPRSGGWVHTWGVSGLTGLQKNSWWWKNGVR